MPKINDYKELVVWKTSMELAQDVYRLCEKLPSQERFGITSQMQRTAVSIPSNIAEGSGRLTLKDYLHFLHIARGSASELETQLLLAAELFPGAKQPNVLEKLEDVRKLLSGLIRSLEK